MQVLICIQVLCNATTTTTINYTIWDLILLNATATTEYAILDLLLLNADTYVSTHPRDEYLQCTVNKQQLD